MEFNNNQIRRQDRLLSEARAYEILKEGEYGVLSLRPSRQKTELHRRMHKCFLLHSRTHKSHSRRIYHCIRKHRTSLYGTSQSARSRTYVCPVTVFKQILPQRQNKRAGICTKILSPYRNHPVGHRRNQCKKQEPFLIFLPKYEVNYKLYL